MEEDAHERPPHGNSAPSLQAAQSVIVVAGAPAAAAGAPSLPAWEALQSAMASSQAGVAQGGWFWGGQIGPGLPAMCAQWATAMVYSSTSEKKNIWV